MRAIFPMYDTPFQFLVLENSGTQSVAEMVGKRVGVGPRGGTSAAYFPEFFRKLNVSVNFVFGEWAELAAQVHRRELDVLAVGAGVPVPSFLELEARDKVRYIAFSQGQLAELRLAMPELTPSRIPAGMYPSLLRNYETVGLYNFAVAHADLPDDFVYQVVRAVFENQDEMILRRRKQFLPTSIGTHLFRSIQGPSVITGPDRLTTCLRGVGPTHLSSRLVQRNEEVETKP